MKITEKAKYRQKGKISQNMPKITQNTKTAKSPKMPNITINAKYHQKCQISPKRPKIARNAKAKKLQKMPSITKNAINPQE